VARTVDMVTNSKPKDSLTLYLYIVETEAIAIRNIIKNIELAADVAFT